MKKKDLLIISGIVAVLAIANFITNQLKQQIKTENIVVVKYGNEVIFEFDITIDAIYEVEGKISKVIIEVKDEKYHVLEVGCPDQLCKKKGWISKGDPAAIICAPNHIVIEQQMVQ